jgi:DNA-binding PadR family transcriptional regulator
VTATFRRSPLGLAILSLLENGPMHPYGIQRLIKTWGKDQVVNVGQRTSLYRMIARLEAADLVAAGDTQRDERYPERTVYHLTDAGRTASRDWLRDILSTQRNEFPEFPAALSFAMMLPPADVADLLEGRRGQVTAHIERLQADMAGEIDGYEIPRVVLIETEYQLAVANAELQWLAGILGDLRSGALSWDPERLTPPPLD